MITTGALIAILREIPETRLELIDVAWDLIDEKGDFDYDQALVHIDRVERAIGEVESYVKGVHDMEARLRTWLLEGSDP